MSAAGGYPTRSLAHRLRFIASVWRPLRGMLGVLLLFTLLSSAVATAYPLVLKVVIDGFEEGARSGRVELSRLLLILGLIGLGRVAALQYPAVRAWLNLRIAALLRLRVLRKIVGAGYQARGRFRTGDLVTRLTSDLDDYPAVAWFCCSGIFRALDSLSKATFAITAMLWLSPLLTVVSLAPLPFMLLVFYRVQRRLGAAYVGQQETRSETNDLLESAFSGIQILKAFNTTGRQSTRLADILERRIEHQYDVQRLWAAFHIVDNLATRVGQVVALCVGALLVLDQRIGLGTLYAVYVYLDMLIPPLQDLPHLLVTGKQAFASMDRLEAVEEACEASVAATTPPSEAEATELESIALDGVTCRYADGGKPALTDVTVEVRRGERLAIVGSVGSGKSTLVRLLAGLLPASDGTLRVNGAEVPYPVSQTYRRRLGFVSQESLLFSAPIRWNVTLGREAEAKRVDRALQTAQLESDLATVERADRVLWLERGRVRGCGRHEDLRREEPDYRHLLALEIAAAS